MNNNKNNHVFMSISQVLDLLPLRESVWLDGVKNGTYPSGYYLGGDVIAWKVSDIERLVESFNCYKEPSPKYHCKEYWDFVKENENDLFPQTAEKTAQAWEYAAWIDIEQSPEYQASFSGGDSAHGDD